MGSMYAEVEIEDSEIIDHLASHPDLITRALRYLAAPDPFGHRKPEVCARYDAALRCLANDGSVTTDNPYAGFSEWAEAFRQMDVLDRERALIELERTVPGFAVYAHAGAA